MSRRNRWCFALHALLLLSPVAHAGDEGDARIRASQSALLQAARAQAAAPRAPLLTREQLLQRPPHFDVQLAGDGRHLSFRRRDGEDQALFLRNLDSGREQRLVAESERVRAQWSDDGQRLWLADDVGLAVFEIGDALPRRVFKWDRQRRQQFVAAAAQAPRFAVIREQTSDNGRRHYRYLRVDAQGHTQLLLEGPKAVRDLLLQDDGQLAFSSGDEGPQFETVVRRHDNGDSREVHRCGFTQRCRLLAYTGDRRSLYLLAPDADGLMALQRWDEGIPGLHRQHGDPQHIADASYPLWQADPANWLAIAYQPDRRRWHGRDARVDAQLQRLQDRLPEANLSLATDRSGSTWLVAAGSATWPGERHYLYRPAEDRQQALFADHRSTMPAAPLAPSTPISYRASDGMLLHAYVTLPRGRPLTAAPLVALIHGGPYNRDRDGFDALVQLLANRGCIVLQPNFRGSTGYGIDYLRAAGGELGNGRVLADILDGLDHLLAAGIGDAQQQALMGHSFGGYASLLGAVHRPGRFRVVVATAAPVDLAFSMRHLAAEGGSGLPADGPPAEILLPHFGMPFADATWHARMRRESPLAQVTNLRAPVYLWAGARDDRVPLADIVRFRSDAGRSGPSPTLLIDSESGHNPDQALSMEALLWLYEAAASRHLGGELQPASPALKRFLASRLHDGNRVAQ
ncbi:MAG TPA: alpha/beta fold hydrolase [Arenimonas sp.]|nr:alpha/beta fold hydrolase [Arenimonas sp.]